MTSPPPLPDTSPLDPSAFWHAWADRLRAHPGRPRLVWRYDTAGTAKAKAHAIRHGRLAAFREGGFDARSRGREVWVVYGTFGEIPVPALDVTSPELVALLLCLARMAGAETHPDTTENDMEET